MLNVDPEPAKMTTKAVNVFYGDAQAAMQRDPLGDQVAGPVRGVVEHLDLQAVPRIVHGRHRVDQI